MPFFSAGYSGPKASKYLLIDGGFLRETARKFSELFLENEALELEYSRLKGTHTKVFYYDALPKRRHGEELNQYEERSSKQKSIFEKIQSLEYFHVVIGAIDGNINEGVAQKGVDVRLSVDALLHSLRGNTRDITIFTSDSDFIPLLSALVQNGVNVTLMYDPQKANEFLVRSADIAIPITADTFRQYLPVPQQGEFKRAMGWIDYGPIKKGEAPAGSTCLKNIEVANEMYSFLKKDNWFFCERFSINPKKRLGVNYSTDLFKLQRMLEWNRGLKLKALSFEN